MAFSLSSANEHPTPHYIKSRDPFTVSTCLIRRLARVCEDFRMVSYAGKCQAESHEPRAVNANTTCHAPGPVRSEAWDAASTHGRRRRRRKSLIRGNVGEAPEYHR